MIQVNVRPGTARCRPASGWSTSSPVAEMREYVTLVRALLAGEIADGVVLSTGRCLADLTAQRDAITNIVGTDLRPTLAAAVSG
jgi:hypothetical protein